MSQHELPDMPPPSTYRHGDEFARDSRADGRRYATYNRRRSWFIAMKQSLKCCVCGHTGELDFHHVNPADKSFEPGLQSITRSRESFINELSKCAPVCPNCHRAIHSGTLTHKLDTLPRSDFYDMPN